MVSVRNSEYYLVVTKLNFIYCFSYEKQKMSMQGSSDWYWYFKNEKLTNSNFIIKITLQINPDKTV